MKGDVGAELGKAGRKEGFTLLRVEGAFDQIPSVRARETGGVDGDLDSRLKGGSEKREAL